MERRRAVRDQHLPSALQRCSTGGGAHGKHSYEHCTTQQSRPSCSSKEDYSQWGHQLKVSSKAPLTLALLLPLYLEDPNLILQNWPRFLHLVWVFCFPLKSSDSVQNWSRNDLLMHTLSKITKLSATGRSGGFYFYPISFSKGSS